MNLTDDITLVAGVYTASVGLETGRESLSGRERDVISQFGEPLVECGGDFTSLDPVADFELPARSLRFPSQFPARQTFSIADGAGATEQDKATDANNSAIVYNETIKARVEAAIDALLLLTPGTLRQQVVSL